MPNSPRPLCTPCRRLSQLGVGGDTRTGSALPCASGRSSTVSGVTNMAPAARTSSAIRRLSSILQIKCLVGFVDRLNIGHTTLDLSWVWTFDVKDDRSASIHAVRSARDPVSSHPKDRPAVAHHHRHGTDGGDPEHCPSGSSGIQPTGQVASQPQTKHDLWYE